MDQRFGAWAWLLSLFRLVYDGGGHEGFHLPTCHGQLFDPYQYPFLEGRPQGVVRGQGDLIEVPRVPDGCLHRVLQALLVLDGERLSYRALDVEQIGSVYEAMMGFVVESAAGRCIGVKSSGHKPGAVRADPIIDIDALLAEEPGQRSAWLEREAGCELTGKSFAPNCPRSRNRWLPIGHSGGPRNAKPRSHSSSSIPTVESKRRSSGARTMR